MTEIACKRSLQVEGGRVLAAFRFARSKYLAALLTMCAASSTPALAEAYIPADDGIVLERLRPANAPAAGDLKALAEKQRNAPNDFTVAEKLVQRYIEEARKWDDPRYVGYAEAVLGPWLQADPPLKALVLRAVIRQYNHDFSGAFSDLDRVLSASPGAAQAHLTRASLHQLSGKLDAAKEDCSALRGRTLPLIHETCLAGVKALSGEAKAAYSRLAAILTDTKDQAPRSIVTWAQKALGDIAARAGNLVEADAHYRAAIDSAGSSVSLVCIRADLLLWQARPKEAAALLGDDLRSDLILLRHAEAAHALGDPAFERFRLDLEARFAASAMRGDERHLREEARFRLLLPGQEKRALKLARRNWQTQREPEDARVLLSAALAAGDTEAAAPVLEWLRRTGLEDIRITEIIGKLKDVAK